MLKRARFIALIKTIQVLNYILKVVTAALANQTLNVIEKSNISSNLSFLFETPCFLDDSFSEENTRESLRTWETRASSGDHYDS